MNVAVPLSDVSILARSAGECRRERRRPDYFGQSPCRVAVLDVAARRRRRLRPLPSVGTSPGLRPSGVCRRPCACRGRPVPLGRAVDLSPGRRWSARRLRMDSGANVSPPVAADDSPPGSPSGFGRTWRRSTRERVAAFVSVGVAGRPDVPRTGRLSACRPFGSPLSPGVPLAGSPSMPRKRPVARSAFGTGVWSSGTAGAPCAASCVPFRWRGGFRSANVCQNYWSHVRRPWFSRVRPPLWSTVAPDGFGRLGRSVRRAEVGFACAVNVSRRPSSGRRRLRPCACCARRRRRTAGGFAKNSTRMVRRSSPCVRFPASPFGSTYPPLPFSIASRRFNSRSTGGGCLSPLRLSAVRGACRRRAGGRVACRRGVDLDDGKKARHPVLPEWRASARLPN